MTRNASKKAAITFRLTHKVYLDGVTAWATNARTRKAIRKVWESIPMADRAVMCERLEGIYSHRAMSTNSSLLGHASPSKVVIWPIRYAFEVELAQAVLAHELAHFFHAHPDKPVRTAREELRHEIEADDTAERWGYPSDGALRFAIAFRDEIVQNKPRDVLRQTEHIATAEDIEPAKALVNQVRQEMAS